MKAAIPEVIIIGIKGTVLALDRQGGAELWRTELKGSEFVNLVRNDNEVLATTRGEIFCMDQASGRILWHNPLTGLGRGLVSIATADGQMALLAEEVREEEQQASTVVTAT